MSGMAAPHDEQPTAATIAAILDAETAEWGTVREYLAELLAQFWQDAAGSKRGMTGESDWRYDLYQPMADLGLIPRWRFGYGIEYPEDGGDRDPARRKRADALILAAIRSLGAPTAAEVS